MSSVDVLAVAAHPDDAEVGCGGVLALCARSGARTAIADLTGGELSTQGTPELREREAREAGEILGVATRVSVGLPDGSVGVGADHRDAVVELIRRFRPRIVLSPYPVDDRHPDHAAAGRLVRDACFFAGVAKRASGEPHRPDRLYHYMLHHLFEPTFVVDVTPVWKQRLAAIEAYRSQFGHAATEQRTAIGGSSFREFLAARAAVHGALIGVPRGEAYYCVGPVGLDGLPGPVSPPPGDGPPVYRANL